MLCFYKIILLLLYRNTIYMYSSQLLKGTFHTIILKLLSENRSMYGYELIQKVKELSNNEIVFPAGSLYPILHKMEAQGLVITKPVQIGKRVRRYYDITPLGVNQAREHVEEFMQFARTMITLLRPQESD